MASKESIYNIIKSRIKIKNFQSKKKKQTNPRKYNK